MDQRGKARLILIFSTNTNCEDMAYRPFRSEKCSARGVRKVTTGMTPELIQVYPRPPSLEGFFAVVIYKPGAVLKIQFQYSKSNLHFLNLQIGHPLATCQRTRATTNGILNPLGSKSRVAI